MEDKKYTWVETHKQLSNYLLTKENSSIDLINLLKSLDIGPFNDKSHDGDYDCELDVIDPFTFYCYIFKYGPEKRLMYLRQIAEKLGLNVPTDELGIPSVNAQKVWMFPYKYLRKNNEIERLWSFFKKALNDEITDEDFNDVLRIRNVAKTRLTEALFYIMPEKYFPINKPSKPFLKDKFSIDTEFETYTEYKNILLEIRQKIQKPFSEISFDSWKWQSENADTNYWIFQGNPNVFDFETALKDEILTDWTVTAHKDKIKIGDKVIIWITGTQSGCYALAEVTSEPSVKISSPDDHLWKGEVKSTLKADIKITHNLADNPILQDDIRAVEELNNLKVGNQGTNFKASKEEYEALVEIAKSDNKFQTVRYKFDNQTFDSFIQLIRRVNKELSLEMNDPRIVYSVRGYQLNYIIGQRYCLNIYFSDNRGVFGIISKDKLKEDSKPFDGKLPQPFYNYFASFDPKQEEWLNVLNAIKDELGRTKKSSYKKYNNSDFENYVFEKEFEPAIKNTMNHPLNTILYGPPGTGKTYNTVLRAAEIIENRTIENYKEALDIFNKNLHNQIEFITFHQNYSYEDFIQGLRPDTENDSQLSFEKKDGVFKLIADRALNNLKNSEKPIVVKKSFDEVFALFFSPLIDGEVNEIKIKMRVVNYYITAVTHKSIEFRKESGGTNHTLSLSTLRKMYDAESILDIQGLSTYYTPLLNKLLDLGKDITGKKEVIQKKNFVIIIDEINRANISRVFGELITLIEPDKRSGGQIPLQAKLPSGDTFMVPSNLYIIGTMNTADKSIALLDIALRRRFEFESMYPKYEINNELIYDVDILKKLNDQIVKTKGHDFQIGHAYFMGENNDLLQRMNKKVIPLLLEYYMNDEKEVKGILMSAGLVIEENSWPISVTGKND